MSDDNISSAPLDQAEVDAQAAALLQSLRDNVESRESNISVKRTFVHLRQEDAAMKAIRQRNRMQTLVTEERVKDIAFSKRHTTNQMTNLLATNITTLAGVNPTSYVKKIVFSGHTSQISLPYIGSHSYQVCTSYQVPLDMRFTTLPEVSFEGAS